MVYLQVKHKETREPAGAVMGERTMIEWRLRPTKYGTPGHNAYLGKAPVGWAGWSKLKRCDPPYKATLSLPGYKDSLGQFDTEEDARARVEKAVAEWLNFAGLTVRAD